METVKDSPAIDIADDGSRVTEAEVAASTHRVSLRTNVHDEGSDANDTADGLTEMEEAVRHAAEDIPTGQRPEGPIETVPVFDRGSLPPKV
ncbi:hypothetical protein [Bosea sp. (in: a-proteobacteria)]|uniref:hypothetical protein n=1 Tax=Bosea sp. (in: a-proteobacteria) TaxID=1871050 RepID=UPI002734911B|nr:hypothetical protein [Bosea sp. (in: a-proteobacteria)]MDP3408501.1 hypothetical protein [Bosea sp. (in: a-proteobacteria)]